MKIGVMLFTANDRRTNAPRSYDDIRAAAQQLEADGFDSIWLADHLLYRTAGQPTRGIWECWTILSALAEATKRVELGTLTLCNSFRNPAILAKMAATADEVSHGRLTLGIGAGWNEPEYEAFGLPYDHRVDRFEEALQILRPLLRDGHVDHDGRYYKARNCEIAPRGPRPHGPPLMIGSGTGPRMLELAARYADAWNTGYAGGPETMVKPVAQIAEACRSVGRDPATLETTALIGVWFPDLQEKAPAFFPTPLTSTAAIVSAMQGYESLGVTHLMFQLEPYGAEALARLTEALHTHRPG